MNQADRERGRMNGYEYIMGKQEAWAKNRGIALAGRDGLRGRAMYTADLGQNLFEPLCEAVRKSFEAGDGDELKDKMRAVHSSSALGVNVFHYWKRICAAPVIAAACGFCRKDSEVSKDIEFEKKYDIDNRFSRAPNIDVVITNHKDGRYKVFAVECKFSEAYGGRGHGGLKPKYLEHESLWEGIANLRGLAGRICPDDTVFRYLHPAQLIKHILGLKQTYGKNGFRLLYLWYDVIGPESKGHHDEAAEFAACARADGIQFHSLTYQELIMRLSGEQRAEHEAYVRYLSERYL